MLIVAELSASHLGSLGRALEIINAAADAGANAVKFQTWRPDGICVDPAYRLATGPWAGQTLQELYREAWTPWEWHPHLFAHARERGLIPFSAPFDRESADFLETLDCPLYKVASFELTDLDLIQHVAMKRKPMVLSTGMASVREIERAQSHAFTYGCPSITLVVCTSAYPAQPSEAGLGTMEAWIEELGAGGLSDHSRGIGVAVAAAALGATYIEKHLTLSRADGGPDSGFAMEPDEFALMVRECRAAREAALSYKEGPSASESPDLRRSLWVVCPIRAGDPITRENVRTARPALGMSPRILDPRWRASRDLEPGTPFVEEMIA
jgi:N-acetylneuraminate synthase